jgi:hypothetical protein
MRNKVIWIFCILLISLQTQAQTLPSGLIKKMKQASVVVVGDTIIAYTGKIERKWCWNNKGLLTTSIKDISLNKEWAKPTTEIACDWNLPGAIGNDTKATFVSLDVHESTDDGFSSPHLELITSLRYESARLEVQHVVWLYPNAPGIRTQLRVKALNGFLSKEIPNKEEKRNDCGYDIAVPSARCEYLPLNFSVENSRRYWGYYNNPGGRHDPSRDMLEETVVKGYPLFLTEDNNWASGLSVEYNNGENGVCLVKESPKCVNQQAHYTGSYYSGPNGLAVTGWGLTPDEITTDRYRECWATWTIVWSQGNDGLQLALKQFDRARYPVFPERDQFILSNTWGPANPDGAQFTELEYLMKEIPALANLGIDVMQIDDGWQKGGRFSDAHGFSPKYKNGWKDIKAEADKYKLRFGLWVTAKLSTTEELNKNVDELGFVSWKADFDHLATRGDYEERIKKYRDVMKHSWLKTQFSLCPEYDDPRYGWYFCKEYGSIYFQNIQESLPAHLTMVPYQVLRQHWLMSKYFNGNKLQVMLQNPKRTNPERSDAPQYSHSYCFAMGVPFVPCFFQSAQYLDKSGQEELKNFITLYKKYRKDIFESYSFPIGEKPSNDSWSGFQFVNESMDKGYFLLFRELHNQEAQKSIQLKFLAKKTIRITNLETGESVQKRVSPTGELDFKIENPAGYVFLTYSVI